MLHYPGFRTTCMAPAFGQLSPHYFVAEADPYAEKDTFVKLGAPDDSLQVYEMFLPFAVALGVDYAWGRRFKNIIRQAIANNEVDDHRASMYEDSYTNRWFKSDGISQGLTSAISSSSTPPGSSSGGGGGGFSGGGGGGGGGGGW